MFRLFRKQKFKLLNEQYKVSEAFKLNGKTYYTFDDATNLPAGRGLCAMTFYEEFNQRCTREYLELHTRAMEKVLSDPKKINLSLIVTLNSNLKERLDMAIFPDHIYKLASVMFFDESESPYNYDYKYNLQKIEEWKASGGTLDFFSRTALKDLIPSLQLPEVSADKFFLVSELVNELHLKVMQDELSRVQ